ncbi:hypothetical protein BH09GEM1_BH09GEM1_36700 [soil metagenome]
MGVTRVVLATGAVWAVGRELHDVDMAGLTAEIASLRTSQYLLGATCTVLSFLLLGVIEWMALRRSGAIARMHVPAPVAVRTGFVANALSQSIGLSVLTGAAVRARSYARYGLEAFQVAQATAFVTITATLGLLAAGAVAVFVDGAPVSVGAMAVPALPAALGLASIVAAYLLWSASGQGESVGWRRWRLPRPAPGVAVAQLSISTLDWLLTGAVLYAFMPHGFGLRIGMVLGAYLVAQVVAVTSHVPAGAGIFELVVIAILLRGNPAAPRAALAAALVMFRVVYYLVPLCVASVMAAVGELSSDGRSAVRPRERGAASLAAFDHVG